MIWSTKDRHSWLGPGIREKAHAFLAGAVRQCDGEAYRVGGVADHVEDGGNGLLLNQPGDAEADDAAT